MYGYKVLTADNGLQAVNLYREHADEIGLVILDLTMPVMGGQEALRELRAIRRDVRVIVCSGYSEMDTVQRLAGERAELFLQKPYTARKLAETVRQALDGVPKTQTSVASQK
jgi:CheY-like chemotaxis protein